MKKMLAGLAVLSLSTTVMAQSLELEYCTQQVGSLYEYKFECRPDAGWQAGMGWRWYIFGDCTPSCPSPIADFAMTSAFPVGPWTSLSSSGGGHNGPTFASVLDYWIPASGTETLNWSGTSATDLAQGACRFSTLAGTVGGAVAADNKVANRNCGPACTGNEAIKKAKCKKGKLKVKTAGGNAGETVTVTAGCGTGSATVNGSGNATVKIKPCSGSGTADASWTCGAKASAAYTCS